MTMQNHLFVTCLAAIFCVASLAQGEIIPLFLEDFLIADAEIEVPNAPKVESYLIPAEACKELPRFKALLEEDPKSNKILFRLVNFPKEEQMVLEVKRMASLTPTTYETLKTFTVHEEGVIETGDHKQQPALVVTSRGFLPGERATFRFRTLDNTLSKEVSLYPKPMIARDKNGQTALRAELVSIVPTVYQIELLNMKEDEAYLFVSQSGGQIVKSNAHFHTGTPINYTPENDGRLKGGTSRVEIRKKSGDVIVVSFPWGSELQHHLDY